MKVTDAYIRLSELVANNNGKVPDEIAEILKANTLPSVKHKPSNQIEEAENLIIQKVLYGSPRNNKQR